MQRNIPIRPVHNWFNEARFGMFIHFGAYSAAGRSEWVANREQIPKDEYIASCVNAFDAGRYDPDSWAALAKEAGMGYAVLTARHHDGFALWPTGTTDFHSGNLGPKRDLVGPYVEAFRRAGLKVGLYYSPADWYHPDYPGPYFRDWPTAADWTDPIARERFIAYYRQQLRELMTRYGPIDYLWFDGCIPENLRSREANEEVLRLQPDILISERNGPPWHVRICEQEIKPGEPGVPWEACMTLNDNWGYHAGDSNWKSPRRVIQMLTETASQAGNLLLNVGPRGDGTIPEPSIDILREVGSWISRHGRSIRNSSPSPFGWITSGRMTTVGNCIYLHIWNSTGSDLCLANVKNRVLSARWLHDDSPVAFEQSGDRLFLHNLPDPLPDPIAATIAIDVEGTPQPITPKIESCPPGDF